MVAEPIRDWTPALEQAEGLKMEWVSVQEASWRLRVSPSTVRRWLASGKLSGHITLNGRRASYVVYVPDPLGDLAQRDRNQIEVLRAQLATREQQLAILAQHNERLERHVDALRRTQSLETRRRIAESRVAPSRTSGLVRRVPFLRLLKGRRTTG